MTIKQILKAVFRIAGFEIRKVGKVEHPNIPDGDLYRPLYSPWLSPAFTAEYSSISSYTLVSPDRCYVLTTLAAQAAALEGEFWECGVYKGGTATLLAKRLASHPKTFRLFDTFEGMPETDAQKDWHRAGDFADTSLEGVQSLVQGDFVHFHKGLIPTTFSGLESARIAFAHVDVDIYSAILACCEFIFPRLSAGGFIVFDDYGFPTCPGARAAVDQFFTGKGVVPLVLPTGQAVVFKSIA